MPIIEDTPRGFTTPAQPPEQEKPSPTLVDTVKVGFALENDVVNAVELMSRPNFKADPAYKLGDDLRQYDRENGTSFFDNYFENFVGSQSADETRFTINRIMTENQQREILARSGFMGFVAATAGSVMSPTNFIPLIGPATKIKSAWDLAKEAALIGSLTGLGQEMILQENQVTRPLSESAIGIAGITVMSGMLGGAIGYLTAKELKTATKALNESTILSSPVRPGSVGAAENILPNVGNLEKGARTLAKATDLNPLTRNPVTYNVMTKTWAGEAEDISSIARYATTQLSDAGLRFEGNVKGIATALGGTVENRIHTWYSDYPSIIKTLDENFAKYRFDGETPSFAGFRAGFNDVLGGTNGKLTKSEFRAEIMRALRNGDTHEIPQVAEVAKNIRSKLFDPLLREAQAAGIIGNDIDLKGDLTWVLRDYDRNVIKQNTEEFIITLADHFERKMQDEFAQQVTRMKESQARGAELVQDLSRPADEIAALKEQFTKQLHDLEEAANEEHITALEDTVAGLRAQARALRKENTVAAETARKQLLKDARDMEANAGESFKEFKAKRADARRRLRNLNQSYIALEVKQAAKLERLERAEELNLGALHRAARVGQRVLREMDKWSDTKLDAEISKLKNQFADIAEVYDRGVEKAVELRNTLDTDKIEAAMTLQEARVERLSKVSDRLERVDNVNRQEVRQAIMEMQEASLQRIQRITEKRAVRQQKLRDAAAALDPAQVAQRIQDIRARQAAKEADFLDSWRTRGADDIDLEKGKASFKDEARIAAIAAKDRIMGTFLRLPSVTKLPGERGSEISRVLDIPSAPIEKFLNNDIESVMRTTLRTLAPDIELARRFGDQNATDILGDPAKGQGGRLAAELNDRLAAIKAWGDQQITAGKNAAKIEMEVAKRTQETNETYALFRRNLEAMIGRLRHTWGLPKDPEAMGFRFGKTMLNLNTLRFMGGVVISSIPDVARPVMRYGLLRTMRDAWLPLITDFKNMKLSLQEIKWLAGGLDATMQSRASAIFDLMDDLGRGGKFEQSVEFATRRMGILALFDFWTNGMKELSGSVAHAKFMDSIDTLINGGKNIDVKEATRFLAENGIDDIAAERIWKEMVKSGGADKVNGRWWPNTSAWDPEVRRIYSQAIIRETNNTIVTPGIDKPLWMDESTVGRLFGQFKSFAFASTSRTLMAGLQQRDSAFANGVLMSLALGAFGYYLYAMSVGGETKAKMLKAGPDKWADEAIARSGLLGILGEVQRIAENIPAVEPYATFSGTRSTRRGGDNLLQAFGGPSLDFLSTVAGVATSIHDPTSSTVHAARTLLPWQNITGLRWIFDAMESAIPVKEHK